MNGRHPAPGRLVLIEALINTVDLATGTDALDTPQGRAPFGITERDLDTTRELRESLRVACLAHAGHPPHRTVHPLSSLLAQAPLLITVDGTGEAALRPLEPTALHSRVAIAIATAAADGTWTRLKACQRTNCHRVYFDRSPAGRGRWCSMQLCGSREKMRAYRSRKQT
ncbi:CGNR zinc finger domain-containing protein [Streptomyces sp. NPDC008343]|uniref:CGNR zinc finger domain-containing protein n=1 Tax=Streptomyces sp. NPDC008343 TaxID=3364828 RepID=UPI0036E4C664